MNNSKKEFKIANAVNWLLVGQMLSKIAVSGSKGKVNLLRNDCTVDLLLAIDKLNQIMEIPPDIFAWGTAQTNAYIRLTKCKPSLQYGDTGPYVRYLQYLLISVDIDGIFGGITRIAVIIFQHNHNMVNTGIVDDITWGFLVASYKKSHFIT